MVYLKKTAQDDRVELWETGTDEKEHGDLLDDSNLPARPYGIERHRHLFAAWARAA